MFNEEAFINKMVTSYLSSNKNKRVSNVQKASFGEIMKYIVTSMNLHITPDEAKNALKTGTLKFKNSGDMVALKTVFERDEYDGQSKPVLLIAINNGKGEEHKIKLYDIKVLGSLFFVVGCLLLIYFQKENRIFPFSPS